MFYIAFIDDLANLNEVQLHGRTQTHEGLPNISKIVNKYSIISPEPVVLTGDSQVNRVKASMMIRIYLNLV